jgi:hypothetical protein
MSYLSEKVIITMSERESNLRKEISDKLRSRSLNHKPFLLTLQLLHMPSLNP